MFESDENEGGSTGTLGLLGCPVAFALALVMVLLVVVIAGLILAFGFA
jgi:hypothetical protein